MSCSPYVRRATRLVSVDREVKLGDTAVIDFEGFEDGKPFEGGRARITAWRSAPAPSSPASRGSAHRPEGRRREGSGHHLPRGLCGWTW